MLRWLLAASITSLIVVSLMALAYVDILLTVVLSWLFLVLGTTHLVHGLLKRWGLG